MHFYVSLIALSLLASSESTIIRRRRSVTVEKDLKPAETRVPLLPYGAVGGYEPYDQGLAYGVDPYNAGLNTHYGPGLVGVAGVGGVGGYHHGYGGLVNKPLGPPVSYDSGYLKSGINDAALSLGNHGGEIYRGGVDGKYADGSYHEGGVARDGGYHGLEGYKDNKHHVADDFSNKGYYSGVQGLRKDIGNGEVFDKNQGYSQNAYNSLGDSELAGHKKGHHRTGFKKSYHKDESGNDESFYDSDHDEGNHHLGQKFDDQYGKNHASSLSGGHKLNEFEAKQLGNEGYEGNGKLVALNQGVKDYYGKNGYYNSGNKYGSLGGNQYSNYGKYGQQNGYHNGYNNGRNFEDYNGSKYGSGYGGFGPY